MRDSKKRDSKKSIQDIVFNNPRADKKSPLLGDDDVGDRMLYDGRKDTLKRIRDAVTRIRRKKIEKLASDDAHWSGLQ